MLSSRRDADSIYRPSTLRDYCDTAWSFPLLCRTDGVAMDAAGFSILDNRAGVTFRVELYVRMGRPGDGDRFLCIPGIYVITRVIRVYCVFPLRWGVWRSCRKTCE